MPSGGPYPRLLTPRTDPSPTSLRLVFRQRRPDGTWGIEGVRRVLYRLPKVIAAVEAGEPIYVTEGEKDVHAIEREGAVSTCNPMGAGKWRSEYTEALHGADVLVVGDRDEAGIRHVAEVVASLKRTARKARPLPEDQSETSRRASSNPTDFGAASDSREHDSNEPDEFRDFLDQPMRARVQGWGAVDRGVMARPVKLTSARAERIVAAVRAGASRHVAAQAAGIARSTLQDWLAKGTTAHAPAPYRDFAEAVREAEATAELDAIATIREAADEDWRAAGFLLERRYPDRWGRTNRHELSGPAGAPIELAGGWDLSKLSGRDLAALQGLAEKAEGRP